MTKTFRVLSFLIAALVMLQAFFIVWGVFGLATWIDDGNSATSQVFDDAFEGGDAPFPEFIGLMLHGMNGTTLIPLVALITLVIGIIAKHPGSTKFAVAIFLLVIVQIALGIFGHEIAFIGGLHGINAFILFGTAVMAGVKAKSPEAVVTDPRAPVNA